MLSPFHHKPCPDNPLNSTVLRLLQPVAPQTMGSVRVGSWGRLHTTCFEDCDLPISAFRFNTTTELSGLYSKARAENSLWIASIAWDSCNSAKGKKSKSTWENDITIIKDCQEKRYVLWNANKPSQLSILYQNPFGHIQITVLYHIIHFFFSSLLWRL